MTKNEVKQKVSAVIVVAFLKKHPSGLKVETINKLLKEKKVTKTQIKATIRCGNASCLLYGNENLLEPIIDWCNKNLA